MRKLIWPLFFISVAGFGLVGAVTSLARISRVQAKCLSLGYPHYEVVNGLNFCIARVSGSDVVVSTEIAPPLAWVEVK